MTGKQRVPEKKIVKTVQSEKSNYEESDYNEKNYQKYTSIYCSHRYFVSDSNLVTTVCRRFLFHPQRLHATDDRTGRFYYGK